MSYRRALVDLFDLPLDLSLTEAKNKLTSTVILVNGELCVAMGFGSDSIHICREDNEEVILKGDTVKSISVFLPKTGIYFRKGDKEQLVLLRRKPIRQWKLSYSNSFYGTTFINWRNETNGILKIDPESRVDFWEDKEGKIWHLGDLVGRMPDKKNPDCIICTNKLMYQELINWIGNTNQGVILS